MNKSIVKNILDWVLHLGLAAVLAILIIVYLGRLTVVDGSSMMPTLRNQDVLIIESVTQRFGKIQPGDIVVLRIPELLGGNKKHAVKRVIATEGQRIEVKNGKVYVDGVPKDENYINGNETSAENSIYENIIVPKDCVYVMGDNRIPGKSFDSRAFGAIKKDRIVGKCWIRLFPFSKAGSV